MERYYLSVVVPAYNEGYDITESMAKLFGVLEKFPKDYEVIVVNDGSKDDTLERLIELKSEYDEKSNMVDDSHTIGSIDKR